MLILNGTMSLYLEDYQMEYINILLNEDMSIMLVDLATGKGKSLILMKYLHTIKKTYKLY